MASAATLRLLDDAALDGPTNMARDEALLTGVGSGQSLPTLRLYEWCEPTLSLGYFQPYAEYLALPPPAGKLPVVRRPTGGGAILHDLELTYSITLPMGHVLLSRGPNRLYEVAHDAVIAALAELDLAPSRCGQSDGSGAARGPFFCFARRHCYDILVGEDKIAGSAQRRTRHAVLQHGSIVLANRFTQQPTAVAPLPFETAIAHLRAEFPRAFAAVTKLTCTTGIWSDSEQQLAHESRSKYAGDAWTRRL